MVEPIEAKIRVWNALISHRVLACHLSGMARAIGRVRNWLQTGSRRRC